MLDLGARGGTEGRGGEVSTSHVLEVLRNEGRARIWRRIRLELEALQSVTTLEFVLYSARQEEIMPDEDSEIDGRSA